MRAAKVFISHAAADKKLADHLVDLLQTGIDVPRRQIFCTSLEGMGVPKGTTFVDWIRQELVDASIVVALITPAYFESVFCLCELGATWATQADFYPLIVPPAAYEDLKAVLVGCQAGVADNESDLDDMFERVVRAAGTTPATARWNQKKRTFMPRVRRYSASTSAPRPTSEEAVRLREAAEALEAELAGATETIDDQADVIEQLRDEVTVKVCRSDEARRPHSESGPTCHCLPAMCILCVWRAGTSASRTIWTTRLGERV